MTLNYYSGDNLCLGLEFTHASYFVCSLLLRDIVMPIDTPVVLQ